jgi:ribose transport system permease protein
MKSLGKQTKWRKPSQSEAVLALCVLLIAGFALTLPGFWTAGNIASLARNISILGILALGMAVVVIGRGLDLSQVASMASSAAITIILINAGYPLYLALLIGMVMAVSVGVIDGFLIAVIEMPPLLTTLATALAVVGLTRLTAVQFYVVNLEKGHEDLLAIGGVIWGIPIPVLIFIGMAVLVHWMLSRTVLGRFIYAHGDNPEAARLTGIPTRPLTIFEYGISAAIGYVAGMVMISQTALMHLQVTESTLIFDVIMVVVLGGVSLVGGRGNVMSVVVGTLLIGVLLNGMTIMDMDGQAQDIFKGLVLLIAIVLDSYLHPRDDETSKQGD